MGIRVIIAFLFALCVKSAWAQATMPLPEAAHPSAPKADRVIVKKEARILMIMRGDRVLFTFDIVLGGAPEGDKLEAGDWRTPEGRYIIDWRNASSRFHKSLHISYPSPVDRTESAAEGVDLGGMIMIHGYPPEAQTNPEKYEGAGLDRWMYRSKK